MNRDTLRLLGAGQSIESLCKDAGCTRAEFDAWWKQEAASRAPHCSGHIAAAVKANATIERDRWGIPHIFADNPRDLFFAYGLAMAQDRLFQMDYLRRKGLGRLAEILGNDGLQPDLIARTVGLNRIAAAELLCLPAETRDVLEAFSAGVNASWNVTTSGSPRARAIGKASAPPRPKWAWINRGRNIASFGSLGRRPNCLNNIR